MTIPLQSLRCHATVSFNEATKKEAFGAWNRCATKAEQNCGELGGNTHLDKGGQPSSRQRHLVTLFDKNASEPVWSGYLDGEIWRYVDGMTGGSKTLDYYPDVGRSAEDTQESETRLRLRPKAILLCSDLPMMASKSQ